MLGPAWESEAQEVPAGELEASSMEDVDPEVAEGCEVVEEIDVIAGSGDEAAGERRPGKRSWRYYRKRLQKAKKALPPREVDGDFRFFLRCLEAAAAAQLLSRS